MEKLAVLDVFTGRDRYYLPLMEALGPDRVVFYCQPNFRHHEKNALGLNTPEQTLEKIRQLGVEVVIDDEHYSQAQRRTYFFMDYYHRRMRGEGILGPHFEKTLANMERQKKRFICFSHSTDTTPTPDELAPGDFFLASCEELFYQSVADGKFLCDAQGRPEIGRTKHGSEIVVTGPLHITGEDLSLAKADKGELKKRLAGALGVEFRPGRPLLTYMVTMGNESREADKGLLRLGQQADIVIKTRTSMRDGFDASCLAEGPGLYKTSDGRLNELMRHAADINLADPVGSATSTAVLLGLRHIPVNTARIWGWSPPQPVNFNHLLRDTRRLLTRLAYCIAPINIGATELLLERIHDTDYWTRFDQQLPRIREHIMGRFWLGNEAVDRAALYITRALARGTFTPTPEELPGARMGPGPLTRGFPLDVTL